MLCYTADSLAVQQKVFGKANYISPRNSQQYLYKISPVTTIQVPNKVSTSTAISAAVYMSKLYIVHVLGLYSKLMFLLVKWI